MPVYDWEFLAGTIWLVLAISSLRRLARVIDSLGLLNVFIGIIEAVDSFLRMTCHVLMGECLPPIGIILCWKLPIGILKRTIGIHRIPSCWNCFSKPPVPELPSSGLICIGPVRCPIGVGGDGIARVIPLVHFEVFIGLLEIDFVIINLKSLVFLAECC